jgi:nitrite reductase/ring-hydroxylating ferredoxin subunit
MAEFMRTIKVSELPPGTMKTVKVGEDDVLLVNQDGMYYGIGAICKHEEWDLSEGTLDGTKVTCAGHGSVWDLTTGTAEFDEELEPEPLYDVKVESGFLAVKKR